MALAFPHDWPHRAPVLDAFAAALDAVDPEHAVRRTLQDRPFGGPVTVVAIGKAAAAMARGVPEPCSGIIVSDHTEGVPDGFVVHIGSHPLPDEHSEDAGAAVATVIDASDGPILFLISGGSSSLVELPMPGVEIGDMAAVTAGLLRSGADIVEINTVRRHLSQLKGGRMAQRASGRPARTLIVSDVVGDPLDVIGSGPTVPDPSTFADALGVLDRWRIDVPDRVAAFLAAGEAGEAPETPKTPITLHEVEVVANAEVAAGAAVGSATRSGLPARIETTALSGDAEAAASAALDAADSTGMTFFAGETTVEVTGGGTGGRNQHAALAAAVALAETGDDATFGALATDGVDGPTDGAGAVVDAGSVGRGEKAGLDARRHLAGHDSHPFLEACGDLLRIGPSGTNVGDLWVVWRP